MIILPTDSNEAMVNLGMNKAIELKQVSKRYPYLKPPVGKESYDKDGLLVLRGVSLDLEQGKILGIIGRNGAGKTTLLNIITGVLSPSEGEVIKKGKILGLFNLGVGFQDELTGRENIFLNGALLGAAKEEINNKLSSIVDFSELGDFINMPLGSYSQGMRLRLGFSIVANLDFDILVIDEVLAVGDALFQNKCFQRLTDFRRAHKTLTITSQSMDLIERLCDKVALLDHGYLLFFGDTAEGINKYRALLNTEKFYVGPQLKPITFVENTKKWADDISGWGNMYGTKEVIIESVEFIDKFGRKTSKIKTEQPLRVKVDFNAREKVKDVHFGVAIFRNDGVYCYGPNTSFDGCSIAEINPGKGWFELKLKSLCLAPGDYRISVAIWDKNESLAFDHHYGCYELIVTGPDNKKAGFLNMPFEISCSDVGYRFLSLFANKRDKAGINPDLLQDKFGQTLDDDKNIRVEYVKFLDHSENKKEIFMTNERVKCIIGLDFKKPVNKGLYLWFGIYRDDGIYCQGATISLRDCKNYSILFSKFSLLPGLYSISIGIWDSIEREFLIYHHGTCLLKMVFSKHDHGTIYLDHLWRWEVS
ncbi:MAG: ABC transporter ATP-binding protein [Candidatus Omnitrophota bacterium]